MINYNEEARVRFGDTSAYREHEKKTRSYTKNKWNEVNKGLMAIFAEFAECKNSGISADSASAQTLVDNLKNYITSNYYTCSNEILSGLGKMYICDERFKNNIDNYGEGTAKFVSDSIAVYIDKLFSEESE